MSIIENFSIGVKNKSKKIGIGLGESEFHNKKILYAAIKFITQYPSNIVYFFGKKEFTDPISVNSSYLKHKDNIKLVDSEEPVKLIFAYLDNNTVDAIVRGGISSSKFLPLVKTKFNIPVINRLSLLETNAGYQFFYGPVGIDECNDLDSKMNFIETSINQLNSLDITPKVSVLSGGRISDIGRDERVDSTINQAKKIVKNIKGIFPSVAIEHNEILIEQAIENNVNLIVAPDGISGNLIYRTLVHLGGGKAYGAIYMGLDKVIIDTSRVGDLSEYQGALLLALSLSE
ncbi:MAG: methyltransferase [Promethearchaeota archaeon]|nr:MAG: methyltransferase [Candidatus Lokiarchaeota archaeon]